MLVFYFSPARIALVVRLILFIRQNGISIDWNCLNFKLDLEDMSIYFGPALPRPFSTLNLPILLIVVSC